MRLARLRFVVGLICTVGNLPARAGDQHLASADAMGPAAPVGNICSYEFLDLDDPCAVRDAESKAMLTFAGFDANDRLVWSRGFANLDAWRAYAGNDPCLANDKTEQVGWTLSNGKEDMFWQLQAILYLCPEYRNIVAAVESRPLVYDGNRKMWLVPGIQLTAADNRFDLATATIYWNPTVSSAAGGVQSWDRFPPLVALAHELVHAYQRIVEDETTYSSPLQVAAMKEENLLRHAFYRRVPGYGDLRPRPGNAGVYLGPVLQYLFDDVEWADWPLSYAPRLDVFLEQEGSSAKYQVSSAPSPTSSPPDLLAPNFALQTSDPRLMRAAQFAGGAGTAAAPYEIATGRQLVAIGADPNLLGKYFALSADIDLDPNLPGGQVFPHAVIAYDEDLHNGPRVAFTGRFYGNGHAIRRLTIDGAGMQYLGLFGRIGAAGRIYDLALEEVRLCATDHAGALAGLNEGGITNCSVTGRIQMPELNPSAAAQRGSWLGGLVGINAGTMIDCRSDVTLTAGDHGLMLGLLAGLHRGGMVNCCAEGTLAAGAESLNLGGLAGACSGGIIRDSRASGQVWGGDKSWALGALAGRADSESVIANCSASGAVTGGARSHDLGGLIGTCFGVEIADCSAIGEVTGGEASHSLGGLLGSCLGATVSDCYATGTISGFRMLGGFAGRVQAGSSIIHCHAVGRVLRGSGPWGQGGFAGYVDSPTDVRVTGCFWDVEASQASASAVGTGLTTAQMQEAHTFQAAGWDMAGDRMDGTADLWLLPEGGRYPVLAALSDSYRPHTLQGTGISSDPYRIATAEDLGAIGRYSRSAPGRSGAAGWYRLVADIDLSGITWSAPLVAAFDGIFDGRGHRIRSLTLRGDSQERVGLFGRVGREAWVFDLGLEDISIDAPDRSLWIGGLAGENAGHLLNCYVTATIVSGSNCRSLGGLVGVNWLGGISDCYTVADLRAAAGSSQVGGLVGYDYMGTVLNCYTAGRVRGDEAESLGALAGRGSEHAATSSCYYLAASAGGGPDRGAGAAVTAEQMRHQATFVDWDFRETWIVCEGRGYPHLQWEGIGCDR